MKKPYRPSKGATRPVKRKTPEQTIHKSILHYLRTTLPHGWRVKHCPNKPRSAIAGALEKSMGAIAGWPDLQILGRDTFNGVATSWFLEIKAPGGRVSPEQRKVHDDLLDIGFDVAVVRSIEETREAVRAWGLPSKDSGQ